MFPHHFQFMMPRFLTFTLFLIVTCPWLSSQTVVTSGTVRGTVHDSSGAVVPGTVVVLRSQDTGQHAERMTNASGMFFFLSQPVGKYFLEATSPGFQKQVVRNLTVQVGQATTVGVQLHPGA